MFGYLKQECNVQSSEDFKASQYGYLSAEQAIGMECGVDPWSTMG